MGITKILLSAIHRTRHPFGLYSKKQAVTKSINIGKELVDATKQQVPITTDFIQTVIKKHVPEAKVKIIQEQDEFRHILEAGGTNADAVADATRGCKALYFNFRGTTKGIYIPDLKTSEDMSNFAHEFEHYMYNEHTPKRKALLSFIKQFAKNKPVKTNTKHIKNEHNLEVSLRNLFGVQDLTLTGGLKGVKPTKEGVDELLKGDNFTGLTDEKRINAYIRTITRHHMHPKNKDSLAKLLLTKTQLDDEARAYKVSDIVSRYASGSDDITWQGLVSDIYSRTSPILKQDILKTIEYIGTSKPKKLADGMIVLPHRIKTGLPSTSYSGEKAADPFLCFGKVEGPAIKLSELRKKSHPLKTFNSKGLTQ